MNHKIRVAVLLIMLLIFSTQSFRCIVNQSATFDEVQNYGIGKYLLQNHKWDVMGSIVHPPLGYYLTSLPLLPFHEDNRWWDYEEKKRDIFFLGAVDVYRGQGLLSGPANANDRLLILSRLPVLLLSLLLGLHVYRFSQELFGGYSGLLSLTIFSFCPNMLAFSGIGTQDMPIAVFWFMASYYFWQFLVDQNIANSCKAGISLGLALSTKLTAMLLLPYQALFYVIYQVHARKKPMLHVLFIPAVAVLLLCGSYFFNLTPLVQGMQLLKIEMTVGQAAFFNGNLSNQSWWCFYPAVFLMKTPLPIMMLFLIAVVSLAKEARSRWFELLYLVTPIVGLMVIFSSSNFAVGVRYLLPIYPFIFVMIGGVARVFPQRYLGIGLLVLWLMVSTSLVSPDYLAYFNEAVGGPANGYKHLVDSNLDWGQGLKELKAYMDSHGIKRITLSYFGADSPQRYGIEYDWLPSHHLYNPELDRPVSIPADQPLAVSVTNLQGVYLENIDEFKWLRQYEPIAKIGYSIFIYDPRKFH